MNKKELIDALASETGFSKKDSTAFLEAYCAIKTKTLAKGDQISLVGFGTYKTATRKATVARNPRTGEEIKVAARRVAKFVPGKELKEAVNKGKK